MALCLSISTSYTQEFQYNVLTISPELKENANVVVRKDDMHIEIKSQDHMITETEYAITVLNKLGDRFSSINVYHDDSRKIEQISGVVYDAMGNEIHKFKKRDFEDRSAYDGFSLFNDGRYLSYKYTPTSYPYTIHYKKREVKSSTAFIPKWYYLGSYYTSIESSVMSITYPTDIGFRKYHKNFEGYDNIEINETPNKITYTTLNLPAMAYEPYAPDIADFLPIAYFGISDFALEGVKGSAANWQEFGKWRYINLKNGSGSISEENTREIKNLVAGVEDPIDKAKIVYEYVQNRVRYISIQEGIGGWTPFPADEVHRLKYGDCKALTNYTLMLLKAVGVESYYTVLWGDESKINVEKEIFSMQGNHVILNLPTEEGDIWLECTSQDVPFGEIAGFTDDRDVLVIKPEGGVIKHTRIYDDRENSQYTNGNVRVGADGNLEAEVSIISKGSQFDNRLRAASNNEKENEKLYKEFFSNINNIELRKIAVTNNKKSSQFEEEIDFIATNYGVISGTRMIIPLNVFNVIESAPRRVRDRKLPIEITRGFYDVDEVEMQLPNGYTVEAMAKDIKVETEYGNYETTFESLENNKLKITRKLLFKTGNYSKEQYTDFRNFYRKIVKSDKSKIVLIKQ
ncbi:hypothetical protein KH5_06510 [Urechidicola sp. KH5]